MGIPCFNITNIKLKKQSQCLQTVVKSYLSIHLTVLFLNLVLQVHMTLNRGCFSYVDKQILFTKLDTFEKSQNDYTMYGSKMSMWCHESVII